MYFSWVSIWDRNISWIQKEKKATYPKINRGSEILPEELGGWKRGKWTAVDIVLGYGDKTSRDFSACVVDAMWCTAADKGSNDKLLFQSRSGRKSDYSGSQMNWKVLWRRVVLVWHKRCVSKWVRSLLQHSAGAACFDFGIRRTIGIELENRKEKWTNFTIFFSVTSLLYRRP